MRDAGASYAEPEMPVIVSMLRGVNVGGHHLIRMDPLRELYRSLDLQDPQTLLQSGNVVFRTTQRNLPALAARIETAIEEAVGFRPLVILRTAPALRDVVKQNPFAERTNVEPAKLAVLFLAGEPSAEAYARVRGLKTDPEELRIAREVYVHYPNGMGRSKLTAAVIEKALGVAATGRNWNTVTKLVELAEQLEGA